MSPSSSSTYKHSLDSKSELHDVPALRYVDNPSSTSPKRGFLSKLRSSPPKKDAPGFVVGGARIDPASQKRSTGPAFIVGGARVEPTKGKKTGPAFVVGGPRIEPSSWPKEKGPFVVGGGRVEPRR